MGYNASLALLGGSTLLTATVMVQEEGPLFPSYVMAGICLIATITLYYSEAILGKEKITNNISEKARCAFFDRN
jgi:hypothetical protein